MNQKTKVTISGIIAAITSFVAWLAAVPPEQQDALLAPVVALLPISFRPTIGLVMRALASASALYGLYQSARSGPATSHPLPASSTTNQPIINSTK